MSFSLKKERKKQLANFWTGRGAGRDVGGLESVWYIAVALLFIMLNPSIVSPEYLALNKAQLVIGGPMCCVVFTATEKD